MPLSAVDLFSKVERLGIHTNNNNNNDNNNNNNNNDNNNNNNDFISIALFEKNEKNMSLLPSVPGSQGILEGVVHKIQTYMGGAVFTYKTYGLVHTQKRWIFMPT